jgi:monovalent cation:H+ antiporter-2, CPA2 family
MEVTAPAILQIGIVLLLAASAGWLMRRVGLPAVVGYLAVGLLVSPFTPGYVADRHQLELFADIGVVLLLFEVGIEIDPFKLGRDQRQFLWVVPLHTAATATLAALIGMAAGLAWKGGLIFGLSIALSSSVVVVNITRSVRRTTNLATNEALLSWSIVQDVAGVVLAAAVLPTLGLQGRPLWLAVLGILAFGAVTVTAAALLPHILRRLQDQPDLFLLFSVAAGLTLAAVGERVFALPLALSAFLAGLAISEGPVTALARQRLLPFRDLFAVLFFVAVGSLIDPAGIPSALKWIAVVLGLVLVLKAGSILGLARLLRQPGVSPWQLAAGLGQIGEFSFVLASVGVAEQLITPRVYAAILCGVVATIILSTIVVRRRPASRPAALIEA